MLASLSNVLSKKGDILPNCRTTVLNGSKPWLDCPSSQHEQLGAIAQQSNTFRLIP